jgi:hypothetical protein
MKHSRIPFRWMTKMMEYFYIRRRIDFPIRQKYNGCVYQSNGHNSLGKNGIETKLNCFTLKPNIFPMVQHSIPSNLNYLYRCQQGQRQSLYLETSNVYSELRRCRCTWVVVSGSSATTTRMPSTMVCIG